MHFIFHICQFIYSSSSSSSGSGGASSSSSSGSGSGGASSSSSSSSSSDLGSPFFLPGRSPNHLGSLVFVLFWNSSNFSLKYFSNSSLHNTCHPPSNNFFLSSYVLLSGLRSNLEAVWILRGCFPIKAIILLSLHLHLKVVFISF